jgi:hypothetical protein
MLVNIMGNLLRYIKWLRRKIIIRERLMAIQENMTKIEKMIVLSR